MNVAICVPFSLPQPRLPNQQTSPASARTTATGETLRRGRRLKRLIA